MRVEDIGRNFTVYIYDNYVKKVPKKDKFKDLSKLQYIADTQTYLSKRVEGILPCKVVKGNLEMPKAPGERVDRYEERKFRTGNRTPLIKFQNRVRIMMDNINEQIEDLGYYVGDLRTVNMFYDEKEDKLYFIDFSEVTTLTKPEELLRERERIAQQKKVRKPKEGEYYAKY